MSYIRTIPPERADGPLAAEYAAAVRRAGKVFNVLQIQSLRPNVMRAAVRLYREIMHGPSGLSRAERELLAVVVSQVNDCHY